MLAATAALAAGVWAARFYAPPPAALQAGVVLQQPRPVAEFSLIDQDGQPFTTAQLRGRWSLLFAGFTHCPDVCPTTLNVMKLLEAQLGPQRVPVQMVFLSVDPQRDVPAQLRQYVRYFSPTITGITGAPEQIERLCAALGLAYVKVPGASDAEYTIDHSAALVLVDPQGRVTGYFQPPHKVDTLAADLSRIFAAPPS